MIANIQPIEKVVKRIDSSLDAVAIWSTIQGEGPFNGVPAVFVRLAGCIHQCTLCDSDYTTGRKLLSIQEMVAQVVMLRSSGLVVITGGEPFRQALAPFIFELLDRKYKVQIETSGSLHQALPYQNIYIVCSPKTTKVAGELLPYISSYKYVVESGRVDPKDGLPTWVLGDEVRVARPPEDFDKEEIYIQPCDSGDVHENRANLKQAVDSCLRFGYRLGIQMHKLVGLE